MNISLLAFNMYGTFVVLIGLIVIISIIRANIEIVPKFVYILITIVLMVIALKLTFNFTDSVKQTKHKQAVQNTLMFERSNTNDQHDNSLIKKDNVDKYSDQITKNIEEEQNKIHNSITKGE